MQKTAQDIDNISLIVNILVPAKILSAEPTFLKLKD